MGGKYRFIKRHTQWVAATARLLGYTVRRMDQNYRHSHNYEIRNPQGGIIQISTQKPETE
jgi:hypothetical protein